MSTDQRDTRQDIGPADSAVRHTALDPERSFIVQAPAGSGKTELLTRRVLTLLARVTEPEQILAITFTRKAASEMRQRVLEMLEQAAIGVAPESEHEAEGQRLALAVLAQDRAHDWQLQRNPQRLNLRTIDSLAAQLARSLPVLSSLGALANPTENAEDLYRLAAERFVDANYNRFPEVFRLLGNRVDHAISLFAELLANRDQWQRYMLVGDSDREALREQLESMLAQLVTAQLETLVDARPALDIAALCHCIHRAIERAQLLGIALPPSLSASDNPHFSALKHWLQQGEWPGTAADDLALWRALADVLLVKDKSGLRKTVDKRSGFPTSKADASKLPQSEDELRADKQFMVELLAGLADSEAGSAWAEALHEARGLPDPAYSDEQWQRLSELFDVLPWLLAELRVVFAERGQLDFVELSARASEALGSNEAPTDLALAMDFRLQHLLIDEFQDTSITQFQLFARMLAGWSEGDGRTVFIVGDPMQSIYRFRDAEVTLFEQARQHGIGPVALEPLQLSVNFRSCPTVVSWVNEHFQSIFPDKPDADYGAVAYAESEAFLQGEGEVLLHPRLAEDACSEAARVADICAQELAREPAASIAVLLRSRASAVAIAQSLRAAGLAFRSVEMDRLGERPVVRDIIALTLALRFPHDRLHWLAVLRAPGIGLALADLEKLFDPELSNRSVVTLLKDDARLAAMSADGQARVQRIRAILFKALKRSPREALMPWVEACWLRLAGPAACLDAEGSPSAIELDAAERAFQRLLELEQSGGLWRRKDIERSMESLFAGDSDTSAGIQLMTLHKSKGLEFDTVILPGLERPPGQDGRQLINWFEGNEQLLLAPLQPSAAAPAQREALNRLVRKANDRRSVEETKRLLYVACTRARQRLHLLASARSTNNGWSKPREGTLLAPLWPWFEPAFDAVVDAAAVETAAVETAAVETAAVDIAAPPSRQATVWQRVAADWQWPEQSVFTMAAAAPASAGKQQVNEMQIEPGVREVGIVVHALLQRIANQAAGSDIANDPAVDDRAMLAWLETHWQPWFPGATTAPDSHPLTETIRRRLQAVGPPSSWQDKWVERVLLAVGNTVSDPRGRWILSPHALARSEWALSVASGEDERLSNYIVDRSFVADGVRWIIDFKTPATPAEMGSESDLTALLDKQQKTYTEQLENYADIISELDDRPIQLGLYLPLQQAFRSWSYRKQA